jgi:hypothetical protein
MKYISDSKSYREYMTYLEKQMENNMTTTFDKLVEQDSIPSPKDNITKAVMEDLKSRSDRGFKKYGTTLHENNHQNMLQHMYEEALDFAQYLKKEITTLNTIQDLVKQFPNDDDLGKEIRKRYVQK